MSIACAYTSFDNVFLADCVYVRCLAPFLTIALLFNETIHFRIRIIGCWFAQLDVLPIAHVPHDVYFSLIRLCLKGFSLGPKVINGFFQAAPYDGCPRKPLRLAPPACQDSSLVTHSADQLFGCSQFSP